jgi:hypothetical protein
MTMSGYQLRTDLGKTHEGKLELRFQRRKLGGFFGRQYVLDTMINLFIYQISKILKILQIPKRTALLVQDLP